MNIEELERTEKERKALIDFIKSPNTFLIMSGSNGTGKTFAARAIQDHLFPKGVSRYDKDLCTFISQAELNLKWMENIQKPEWNTYLLKELQNTKLLVFDDLGTRTPTEAFVDFLYAIVDHRYVNKKSTIITTNLSSKVMREKFSDAFVSRCASGIAVRFEGEDRRFRGKEF